MIAITKKEVSVWIKKIDSIMELPETTVKECSLLATTLYGLLYLYAAIDQKVGIGRVIG